MKTTLTNNRGRILFLRVTAVSAQAIFMASLMSSYTEIEEVVVLLPIPIQTQRKGCNLEQRGQRELNSHLRLITRPSPRLSLSGREEVQI